MSFIAGNPIMISNKKRLLTEDMVNRRLALYVRL